MCQGDLIAFSDQDDEWLPPKLSRILQASRESDALLFAHADEWIDKNGNPLGIVYPLDRRYRKYTAGERLPWPFDRDQKAPSRDDLTLTHVGQL